MNIVGFSDVPEKRILVPKSQKSDNQKIMTKAAFFGNASTSLEQVYPRDRRDRIAAVCDVHPRTITAQNFSSEIAALADLEVIFSTWGMPGLTENQIALMPKLRAVFYAAGSVKAFAIPFLDRGIVVVSAWAANGVPVAEFVLAQTLLANKGYFRNIRDCGSPSTRSTAFRGSGNFHATVALLGAGMIGKKVIELMKPFCLRVIVFDPFLSQAEADRLGVEKVSLADAFQRGMVVSNHLANVPATRGLLRREHFSVMPENAVFINTGRGATVVETDLIDVLRTRPDLTALLDVTDPEPPPAASPFYDLPNVLLSSHIAGSIGNEVTRMADTVIKEFHIWRNGAPLRYAVTREQLDTMA